MATNKSKSRKSTEPKARPVRIDAAAEDPDELSIAAQKGIVPDPKPTADYDGGRPVKEVCINCAFYAAGPTVMRGPHCTNRESPQYMVRMPEFGTCEEFTPKTKAQRANQVRTAESATPPGIQPPVPGEEAIERAERAAGMYDPDAPNGPVTHSIFEE